MVKLDCDLCPNSFEFGYNVDYGEFVKYVCPSCVESGNYKEIEYLSLLSGEDRFTEEV